ncbi:MAG: hypothetical protein K9L98_03880 [Candidatus Pacebacteria bacterium]|nr:hypothetical protein [Candidatus Paceibacterota bacterium]MCF7863115.1 hypothetical protein [Candidatus Paceibacterota bacterium]
MIKEHLSKNEWHHAYLIEGERDIVSNILDTFKEIGLKVLGNPDFLHLEIDSFKIDEALNLKNMAMQKSFISNSIDLNEKNDGEQRSFLGKKIFLIYANNFSNDAQGVLLKIFEEPAEDIHFFVVVPDVSHLSKTLISRFYFIPSKLKTETKDYQENLDIAYQFLQMNLPKRIDFIKSFVKENDDEDVTDSTKSKTHRFLNEIEVILHQEFFNAGNFAKNKYTSQMKIKVLNHLFKIREYLRQTGASSKNLLESLALILPVI